MLDVGHGAGLGESWLSTCLVVVVDSVAGRSGYCTLTLHTALWLQWWHCTMVRLVKHGGGW